MSVRNFDNVFTRVNFAVTTFCLNKNFMKKYFSEKNALTVMVSLFCLVMMFVALMSKQSYWEAIAFALAFSFSIEVVCHRANEKK